jgi:hypothetical protein
MNICICRSIFFIAAKGPAAAAPPSLGLEEEEPRVWPLPEKAEEEEEGEACLVIVFVRPLAGVEI